MLRTPRGWVIWAVGAAGALALLAAVVASQLDAIRRVDHLEWGWVAAALAAALASHVFVGLALAETLAALGYRLSPPSVLGIALVSTTANYVVSTGGATGFALKAHLLHKRRVPIAITLTATVVSTAILYAVLAVILLQGLATLLLDRSGAAHFVVMESALGLLVLVTAAAVLLTAFFNRRVRGKLARRLLRWTNRAAYSLSQQEIPPERFAAFEMQLTQGLARIRAARGRLTWVVIHTGLDWGLAMVSLWLCFKAVSVALPVGHLTAAFTTGQAATLIPILPGGLGAAEGSITALLGGLNVDPGAALVAALLFRVVYYVVPSALSVLVLWGLKVSEPSVLEEAAALMDAGTSKQ